ncbi:MAG TPA: ATP-binding protein [Polyangiaceae bacterium]|nr:ATP-binding protein [Polyangiaceae bacterium]
MNEDASEFTPSEFAHRRGPNALRSTSTSTETKLPLEALLDLSQELEPEASVEELVALFTTRLTTLLPGCQIDIRLDPGHFPAASASSAAPRSGYRVVDDSRPDSERPVSDLLDQDTTHVIPLLGLGASCMRVEGSHGDPPSLWEIELCCKAAQVLGRALHRSLAHHCLELRASEADRLRAQLVHSDRLATLGQLVAGVVHELNNPLTAILAYSEHLRGTLERRPVGPEDLQRLQRIQEAAQHILGFSRDLSSYARAQRNEPRRVPLREIVERALALCEHDLNSSGIRFELNAVADLPALCGVPGQLTQVFVNLFSNAIQAMPNGGLLFVEAALDSTGRSLCIHVRDTGVGISAAHLPRVFEPFFTTKPDGQGTGLGLAIVRELVEAHRGCVTVESEPPGGTTFTLRLPLDSEVTA